MQINLEELGITKEALVKSVLTASGLTAEQAVEQLAGELGVDLEALAASKNGGLRQVTPADIDAIRKGAEASQRIFGS